MKQPLSITRLWTHHQPGSDELATLWAIRRFKHHLITLADDFEIAFMTKGDHQYPSMPSHEMYLGCGYGSPFNEHHRSADELETSTFRLVLEYLGLINYFPLKFLEERITREDRYGSEGVKFHISQVIKDMWDTGSTFEQIDEWATALFDAIFDVEFERNDPEKKPRWYNMDLDRCRELMNYRYGNETAKRWFEYGKRASDLVQEAFDEAHKLVARQRQRFEDAKRGKCPADPTNPFSQIETYAGPRIMYAPLAVQTNIRIMQAASAHGAHIVAIQTQLAKGNVGTLIRAKNGSGISLSRVLAYLRQFEISSRTRPGTSLTSIDSFEAEGTLKNCPEWHGLQTGRESEEMCTMIMSGSKTRPEHATTKLNWESVIVPIFSMMLQDKPELKREPTKQGADAA